MMHKLFRRISLPLLTIYTELVINKSVTYAVVIRMDLTEFVCKVANLSVQLLLFYCCMYDKIFVTAGSAKLSLITHDYRFDFSQ